MLELHDIHKMYEERPLLNGVSFVLAKNQTVCLLGPSGSGKSTILEIIAGLERPDSGSVLWEGRDLADVPPHQRDFGMLFQDYALFPHLDVAGNVAFGLRMRSWSTSRRAERVREVLAVVGLVGFEGRSVQELSGGEQQRVALARALAPNPRLLMLDEPLGALDRALKDELGEQLRRILRRTRVPALYVTHDQDEAFRMADQVMLLHAGAIVRSGRPVDISRAPGSVWVARFLALGNILPARALSRGRFRTPYGDFPAVCRHQHGVGQQVGLLARPLPVRSGSTRLGGTVRESVYRQDRFRTVLSNGLYFDLPKAAPKGDRISVRVRLECLGTMSAQRRAGDAAGSPDNAGS
jgi:ABC-type Fe3+/spermidine/putrescine transport system ATPase subunit